MVKKLELDYNEKGEITSPSYIEIVAKVNEIIDAISLNKTSDSDLI